ncbi:hypothetical protein [Nonomuraea bangladeshensis]|uniref:hypothetical protein n=1 Tax=Nonomuraea bangladeshensis TaxID=404385 RepID=UPI0031DBFCD0
MWIRGTARLTVVALLGIEITIIASASAAAAASHPGGTRAADGTTDTETRYGTPQPEQPAFLTALANALESRTDRAALDRLALLQQRLEGHDGRGGPPHGDGRGGPPHGDARLPQGDVWAPHGDGWAPLGEIRVPRSDLGLPQAAGEPAWLTGENREHSASTEAETLTGPLEQAGHSLAEALRDPVRTAVVRMPKARRPVVHNRAKVLDKQARVDLTRVLPRQASIRMSHATADGWLRTAGLRTKSTGNCTSKHHHHCTSLDKVRTGTVAQIIQLKQESHCPILVTGGTEDGHAPGQFSHGNGYKLDIGHNSCIDQYITKNYQRSGVRGDGARLYRAPSGTTFANESDHWDILFR